MNNLGLEEYKSNGLCEPIQKRGNTTTPSGTDPKQVWVQGVAISETEVDTFLDKRSVGFESRQESCCMWILQHQLAGFKFLDVLFLSYIASCPLADCQLLEGCSVRGQMTLFHQLEFAHWEFFFFHNSLWFYLFHLSIPPQAESINSAAWAYVPCMLSRHNLCV